MEAGRCTRLLLRSPSSRCGGAHPGWRPGRSAPRPGQTGPDARRETRRSRPRPGPQTSFGRELLRHLAALNLARRAAWTRLHDSDRPRDLEGRQVHPAMGNQLYLGHRIADDDRGRHLLTPGRVRNAEANRFLHRGAAFQDFVDLARGNLLPSPVDQLLYPTEKPQISAGIEAAQVPGSKPAIGERLGIRLRAVFVAVGDI